MSDPGPRGSLRRQREITRAVAAKLRGEPAVKVRNRWRRVTLYDGERVVTYTTEPLVKSQTNGFEWGLPELDGLIGLYPVLLVTETDEPVVTVLKIKGYPTWREARETVREWVREGGGRMRWKRSMTGGSGIGTVTVRRRAVSW